MITASRRIQFAAGHRVYGHESKCAHVHGHNYVAMLHAAGVKEETDGIGRVIDFSVLKERVGSWVERRWDHGMILSAEDPLVDVFQAMEGGRHKLFVAPFNPTAELMAKHLLCVVGPEVLAGTGVELVAVTLWETENCQAEVRS